jgi:hypothetical protein
MRRAGRVEVPAGALEARRLAATDLVDVKPVLSRREPGDAHADVDAVLALEKSGDADVAAGGIAQDGFGACRDGGELAARAGRGGPARAGRDEGHGHDRCCWSHVVRLS